MTAARPRRMRMHSERRSRFPTSSGIEQTHLKRMRKAGTLVFWMSLPSGPSRQYCVCTQCILTWAGQRNGVFSCLKGAQRSPCPPLQHSPPLPAVPGAGSQSAGRSCGPPHRGQWH